MQLGSRTPASAASSILPLVAGAIAIGIFVVDTFTILDIAIAVLYAVVVLVAAGFLPRRGVLQVALGCAALTVFGYLLSHGLSTDTALVRCLVSLVAIAVATVLALQNQTATTALRGQARLLDLAHDTIFVRDMHDVITYWNRGAEEQYGWSSEQALGKVAHQLLQTRFPEPLNAVMAKLTSTGRWEGELVHTKRDQTRALVSSRWSLQRDEQERPLAILETNTNITERKRAEDALRRSEAYLAEAQRLSLTGSFGWKIASQAIFWSDETYRIFGYDRTIEPTIELVVQRVHPDDVALMRQTIDKASQDRKDIDLEHRLLMPDGTIKHLRVLAHATTDPSNGLELVGAVTDVSATKRAQEALHQAQLELTHVTRVTMLGELTASIAHEVNQPLTGIITNGEASLRWLKHQVPEIGEARSALMRIISDAERASNVIRRIRDLSKKAAPEMGLLDINDVIEETLLLVQRQALSHRVALRLNLASGLPAVLGDRVQLQQVIINLVINGIEAMAGVGERRELVLRSDRFEADQVLVSVQDSGVGIAPEQVDRLFSAFYTTKHDGMGMGLSICRSIVEAHGGRVWASNNDGPGATIQFALPRHRQ